MHASMNKIDSFELLITKKKGFGSPNDLGCNPYICAHNKLISLSALLCIALTIDYKLMLTSTAEKVKRILLVQMSIAKTSSWESDCG